LTDSPNVALVRSILASWERGDFGRADWAHPEIEHVIADGLEPGRYDSAAMAQGYRNYLSAWEDYRWEVDEFRELDDERVLVLFRRGGQAKASGLDLEQMRTQSASVFHVRDGKVVRLVVYWDRDHAFADLGLAPKDGAS